MRQTLMLSIPQHTAQTARHVLSAIAVYPSYIRLPACTSKNTAHWLVSQQRNAEQASMANQAEAEAEADAEHQRTYRHTMQRPG